MSSAALEVSGLGKRYDGARAAPTLRDALAGAFRRRARPEPAWALRDVSFSAQPGERVGVVGRNGAGKSTLLKLLARITEPSAGRAVLRGRVASLLEVGSGFHPDLSGRENVFLNGAILGMSAAEVRASFTEIVEFAEVGHAIDLPVKRYSSGMHMRLAFSVAAHLRCDVLLIDEVLAVGDVAFQRKCLGAMRRLAGEGRTVLFVSHDLAALRAHTTRCLYLQDGRALACDGTAEVIERYYRDTLAPEAESGLPFAAFRRAGGGDGAVAIAGIAVNGAERRSPALRMLEPLAIEIALELRAPLAGATVTVLIKREDAARAVMLYSGDADFGITAGAGRARVRVSVPSCPLTPGRYFCDVGINPSTAGSAYDAILDYPLCEVLSAPGVPDWPQRQWGAAHVRDAAWSVA